MSDIAYRLVVDMSTRGNLAQHTETMGNAAQRVDTAFASLRSNASSALGGIANGIERIGDRAVEVASSVAKIGAAGAVAGVAFGIGLNSEMEQMKVSLAGIFKSNDIVGSLPDGLQLASNVIKDMRKDAAALPGEFKDLVQIYRLSATPAFQLGVKPQELEKMSAQTMAAAANNGVNQEQAAREMSLLLQGHAGGQNTLGSMLGFVGDKAESFNRLQGKARVAEIKKALAKVNPSAFQDTFEAQKSTLKDNASVTIQRATEPVFNSVKAEMKRVNEWFTKNEEVVNRYADIVGQKLERAFVVVKDKIHEWTPAIKSFAANAADEFKRIWTAAKPLLAQLEKLGLGVANSKGIFRAAEFGATAYGATKLGRMAMPAIGPLAELAGSSLGIEGIAGSIAGLGLAAAVALPVLALGAGVFHVLTDASSEYNAEATRAAASIVNNSASIAEHTANVWDRVKPAVMTGVDAVATEWLGQMAQTISIFEKAAAAADTFTGSMEKWLNKMGVNPFEKTLEQDMRGFTQGFRVDGDRIVTPVTPRELTTTTPNNPAGTTIQKVEIVISSNTDPSRIARLVSDHLENISRFPTSSRHTFNPSAPR